MKEMRSGLTLLLALALPAGAGAPTITVYEHIGFGGKNLTVTGAVSRLDTAWNDQASSPTRPTCARSVGMPRSRRCGR